MKKLISVFITLIMLLSTLTSFAFTTSADDNYVCAYYSGFYLGACVEKTMAVNAAQGFFYDGGNRIVLSSDNLNAGSGNNNKLYLGYYVTTDKNKAYRDIVVLKGSQYANTTSWVNPANNCTYYSVAGCFNDYYFFNPYRYNPFNLNINESGNSYGDNIYLFVTTDKKAGDPICNIKFTSSVNSSMEVVKFQNGSNANLNSGTGGSAIYMQFTRDEYSGIAASIFSNNSLIIAGIAALIIIISAFLGIFKKRSLLTD